MLPGTLPLELGALALVIAAAIIDVRTRRIPNRLTAPALVLGLLAQGLLAGPAGLVAGAAGAALAFAWLLVPFALGGIGGGDVKLMAAVGALLGPGATALSLLLGMAFGGVLMGVHLIRRAQLGAVVARLGGMAAGAFATRSLAPLRVSAAAPGAIALPYSVPLGAATAVVVALRVGSAA